MIEQNSCSMRAEPMSYWAMANGWKICASRPGRGGGGPRQEVFLVAIADKAEAVRAVEACLPDAEIKIESEAGADLLAQHEVIDGAMIVLPDGF
jgi:hypothetical protein